jgi:hypothetical protein
MPIMLTLREGNSQIRQKEARDEQVAAQQMN